MTRYRGSQRNSSCRIVSRYVEKKEQDPNMKIIENLSAGTQECLDKHCLNEGHMFKHGLLGGKISKNDDMSEKYLRSNTKLKATTVFVLFLLHNTPTIIDSKTS